MKITVIGTGYVGLVAGACFADNGNTVFCIDKNPQKISALKKGEIPIYEPGLEDVVRRGMENERLSFSGDAGPAVAQSEMVFMAVGTPPLPSGEPNLDYLKAACEEVARAMTGYLIVVNKSTVPIGSHQVVSEWMRPHTKHPFDVVSNPEFLKEGSAVEDFLKPDRVVIGTDKREVYDKMAELYGPFVRQGNPILWMDAVSAEMTKYACNAFLATRISFMNELSQLCEKVGGDIELVRKGMVTDVRIGKHFLYAGAGYGGSCFPKDVQALMATGRKYEVAMGIVESVEEANVRQKKFVVEKIRKRFGGNLKGKSFGIWGISFKPNTDDIREAPALVIIRDLVAAGASVRAFDPVAMDNARAVFSEGVRFTDNSYQAAEGADALILVTEWNEFRQVDFGRLKNMMKAPVIFDGRNIYSPEMIQKAGFEYYGIGRGGRVS